MTEMLSSDPQNGLLKKPDAAAQGPSPLPRRRGQENGRTVQGQPSLALTAVKNKPDPHLKQGGRRGPPYPHPTKGIKHEGGGSDYIELWLDPRLGFWSSDCSRLPVGRMRKTFVDHISHWPEA